MSEAFYFGSRRGAEEAGAAESFKPLRLHCSAHSISSASLRKTNYTPVAPSRLRVNNLEQAAVGGVQ